MLSSYILPGDIFLKINEFNCIETYSTISQSTFEQNFQATGMIKTIRFLRGLQTSYQPSKAELHLMRDTNMISAKLRLQLVSENLLMHSMHVIYLDPQVLSDKIILFSISFHFYIFDNV
jgi:hypothetical protein